MRDLENDIPEEVRAMKDKLRLVRIYNAATGASISHEDVDDWGYLEKAVITYALEFLE